MWDKDLVGQDDLLGEASIDLNTHNMINKYGAPRFQCAQPAARISGSRSSGSAYLIIFFLSLSDLNSAPGASRGRSPSN